MNRAGFRGVALIIVAAVVATACGVSVPSSDEPASTTVAPVTSVDDPDGTTVADDDADPDRIAADLAAVSLDAIVAAYEANPPENTLQTDGDVAEAPAGAQAEVLYIGAEFCPYCAAERWALTVALSKFGEFSNLSLITSSGGDVPTLSYVGSTFAGDLVVFDPVELQDQDGEPLEDATDAQMERFRGAGGGAFPFIDIPGVGFQKGGSVAFPVLVGHTQGAIAAELAASTEDDTDPDTIPGTVNASAGAFIRAICEATGGEPGAVCDAFDPTV